MLDVLRVTFPFFALVLCGYWAARRQMLPFEAIPGLNGFVLFFALPCMLFRFGANTPIAQLLDAGAFFMYLFCALVMVAFVVAISLNKRFGWNDAAFGALVGAFPNTGFMGVPLLVALLGSAAAGPAIVTIVIDMVITTSLCIALSRLDGAGQQGVGQAAKNALLGVVKNPMPWAILLGTLFSAFQIELPGPVDKTVALLGDAASPVALFTIGAVLARSRGKTMCLWRLLSCCCTRSWCWWWAWPPFQWACLSMRLRSKSWCWWPPCPVPAMWPCCLSALVPTAAALPELFWSQQLQPSSPSRAQWPCFNKFFKWPVGRHPPASESSPCVLVKSAMHAVALAIIQVPCEALF
jgi:predicted permease